MGKNIICFKRQPKHKLIKNKSIIELNKMHLIDLAIEKYDEKNYSV